MSKNHFTSGTRTFIDEEVARILRAAMKERGMLQKDLAAAAGMTSPQVSVRLNNKGGSIPIWQIEAMCQALDLDPQTVFENACILGDKQREQAEVAAKAEAADREARRRTTYRQAGDSLAALAWNITDDEFLDQVLAMEIDEAAEHGQSHLRHVFRFALNRISDELQAIFPNRPEMVRYAL